MMRNVKIVDGRYVQIIDYGPAPKIATATAEELFGRSND
jgi:hypothetical protein